MRTCAVSLVCRLNVCRKSAALSPGSGEWGPPRSPPAIADQQAALYGHGCRAAGEAKITFGTGALALAVAGNSRPDPTGGILPTVAWDLGRGITYALDGGVPDAGAAVEWALRAGSASDLAAFDVFPDRPAIERGLVFLPLFSGLGAPQWDRTAAPLIIGLTPDMGRRDLCQALLEGIAFQTATLLEVMAQNLALSSPISVDGGLAASGYFTGFLAQISQRPLVGPEFSERTAFGTAALAGLVLGIDLQAPTAVLSAMLPGPPRPAVMERFRDALKRSQGWHA